eukprot:1726126-Rhodomonas_salina.1
MHAGVVNELAHVARVDVLPKNVRDVELERCRRVRQPKLHDTELELTEGRCKGRLVTVRLGNGNLPVSPKQVNLGEVLTIPGAVEQILWVRQRKAILDRLGVQGPIVHAHP